MNKQIEHIERTIKKLKELKAQLIAEELAKNVGCTLIGSIDLSGLTGEDIDFNSFSNTNIKNITFPCPKIINRLNQ